MEKVKNKRIETPILNLIISFLLSVLLSLEYFGEVSITGIINTVNQPKLVIGVVYWMTIVASLNLIYKRRKSKFLKGMGFLLSIPALPFIILSGNLYLNIIIVILVNITGIIFISTIATSQLEYLDLGKDFNTYVIPFINLTLVFTIISLLDGYFTKIISRISGEGQFPNEIKKGVKWIVDNKIFMKISYLILTVMFVLTTIEKQAKISFINVSIFIEYKSIILESLLTFSMIDRLVSKWKA